MYKKRINKTLMIMKYVKMKYIKYVFLSVNKSKNVLFFIIFFWMVQDIFYKI